MILVLTYHRVVESNVELEDFFDVTAEELSRHIERLKELWLEASSPGDLLTHRPAKEAARQGFLITFDDGTADHFTTAAPLLERHGVRGVFFANTSLLGKEGHLTIPQCQELQARGHAIESHSHEHKALIGLRREELGRQLAESRRVLREQGLGRWDFLAVPGGCCDRTIREAARAEHYTLLRTLEWGYNRVPQPHRIESITINRKTAGWWFEPLISPRFETAKNAFYGTKERMKSGRLKSLYFGLRDLRQSN